MRVFKNRWLTKFADRQGISDADLIEAVTRAESGLIDADLGGGVIKQRIARQGHGKIGGYRSLILFKHGSRAFVVYAFAKSNRENIDRHELQVYRETARFYLNYTDEELNALMTKGIIMEITP